MKHEYWVPKIAKLPREPHFEIRRLNLRIPDDLGSDATFPHITRVPRTRTPHGAQTLSPT